MALRSNFRINGTFLEHQPTDYKVEYPEPKFRVDGTPVYQGKPRVTWTWSIANQDAIAEIFSYVPSGYYSADVTFTTAYRRGVVHEWVECTGTMLKPVIDNSRYMVHEGITVTFINVIGEV